jgi:hypothetical protein
VNLKYKYTLKKPFTIGYLALICIGFLLTIGRWLSVFESEFIMINEAFHYSVSNLSLSLIIYLAIGLSWLKFGVKFDHIALLGLFIVASNLICETVVRFMNTPDIVDAIYGILGTGIAFVFLYFTNRYGLIQAINEN